MYKHSLKALNLIVYYALAGFLVGCQGIAFSSESAVQQEILRNPLHNFQVDTATYQVLQSVELDDSRFVLVAFEGARVNSGRESCIFLYETFKMFGGWVTGSGGGGCSNEKPDPTTRPVSIGANISGGRDQNDPGSSTVSGFLFQEEITSVRVTWNDGQQQEATISNRSFLAVRTGNPNFTKIEGFDSQGNSIFIEESILPAPGKQ